MTTTVSNAAELQSALSQATGGDTILLAVGNYGSLDLSNRKFTSYVTLRSADLGNKAVLRSLKLHNASFIRIDDLHVSNSSNGAPGGRIVNIEDSDHISIVNSEINGLVDNIYVGSDGILAKNSRDIIFANNYVHDVHNGIVGFGVRNFTISENLVDYVATDSFKFASLFNGLIENNTGGGHIYPVSGAHADFMQFQGSARDVIIRGNVFLAQTSELAQGIFMNAGPYSNLLIEQNIIVSGKVNAIAIKHPEGGSGFTVRNNTVLSIPNLGHNVAAIITPSGSVVQNNISSSYEGGLSGSNLKAQWDDVTDVFHYDTLFANAMVGLGITLEDLRPVAGSFAETHGAINRLLELLDGATPDPIPDPIPDPEPDPEPEPPMDEGMLFQTGPHEFDGTTSSAIVVPHDPAFELAEGSIEMLIMTGPVGGRKGLFSKDASGFGAGGHLGILMDGSQLWVRLQSATQTHEVKIENLFQVSTEYHLAVTWGAGGLVVWVNGAVVGSDGYTGGTIGNVEPLVIGANQWSSSPTTSDKIIDPFNGLIERLSIYGHALTGQEINDIINPPVIVDPPVDPSECETERDALLLERDELLTTIARLEADVDEAMLQLSDCQAAVATLSAQVSSLEAKIAAAQSALS